MDEVPALDVLDVLFGDDRFAGPDQARVDVEPLRVEVRQDVTHRAPDDIVQSGLAVEGGVDLTEHEVPNLAAIVANEFNDAEALGDGLEQRSVITRSGKTRGVDPVHAGPGRRARPC